MKKAVLFSLGFCFYVWQLHSQIPTLVKDINPGNISSNPEFIGYQLNGGYVFTAETAANGRELWFTDASTGGTFMIKDINPGSDDSNPGNLYLMSGLIYFGADNGTNGRELWKTDGTTGGTQMVKDIAPGSLSGFSQYCCGSIAFNVLWEHNGIFYFRANQDGTVTDDVEIWKSDGTTAGTELLKDIYPGINGSQVSGFVSFNNEGYFTAENGITGRELWKTDGTTAGTQLVKDIKPGTESGFLQNCCGYFSLEKVWEKNGSFFFLACDFSNSTFDNKELWKTDGTTAGTVQVADIKPGNDGSLPAYFFPFNNNLLFTADNGTNGRELWITDGTGGGTQLVKDIKAGSESGFLRNCCGNFQLNIVWEKNGYVFFNACSFSNSTDDDYELWKSDGTNAGTVCVKDIKPGNDESNPSYFTAFNNDLYFIADDGTHGMELWKTDGDAAGTQLVKDIKPGAASGFLENCCGYFQFYKIWEHNGSFFFVACSFSNSSDDDTELWKSDGTNAGTERVADINPGNDASYPSNFIPFNNELYFSAKAPSSGRELYKTDGTTTGTILIKDIYPGVNNGIDYNSYMIIWAGNTFYFVAVQLGISDYELWKTDGTTSGTEKVLDIFTGASGSHPNSFLLLQNDNLIFVATDATNGKELWKMYLPGVTAVEEFIPPGLFSVYPNPNNGEGINVTIPTKEKSTLVLTDLSGRQILSQTIPEGNEQTTTRLTTPELKAGFYLLYLSDEKNRWVRKIEILE